MVEIKILPFFFFFFCGMGWGREGGKVVLGKSGFLVGSDLGLHGLLSQSIQRLGEMVLIMKIATYLKEIMVYKKL